jgi:hypothetical protein
VVAGRFGLLATLPLGDPDAAITEIRRGWHDLHADGFYVVSNYDGVYLGDRRLDGAFAELDRLGATVFAHPVVPPGFNLVSCGRPGPVFEFPVDTARTVVDALYSGVFTRYPRMRFVLAHAGGVLLRHPDRQPGDEPQGQCADPLPPLGPAAGRPVRLAGSCPPAGRGDRTGTAGVGVSDHPVCDDRVSRRRSEVSLSVISSFTARAAASDPRSSTQTT